MNSKIITSPPAIEKLAAEVRREIDPVNFDSGKIESAVASHECGSVPDERAAYKTWAEREYRHSENFTQRDFHIGLHAWEARAGMQPPATVEQEAKPDSDHLAVSSAEPESRVTPDGLIEGAPADAYTLTQQAFHHYWYSHMVNDMIVGTHAQTSYASAWDIWNAALQSGINPKAFRPNEQNAVAWLGYESADKFPWVMVNHDHPDVIARKNITCYTHPPVVQTEQPSLSDAQIEEIAAWLDEAASDVESWGAYADDYFQNKWDLTGAVQFYKACAIAVRGMAAQRQDSDKDAATLSNAEIARMISHYTGINASQFPDEYDELFKLCKAIYIANGSVMAKDFTDR